MARLNRKQRDLQSPIIADHAVSARPQDAAPHPLSSLIAEQTGDTAAVVFAKRAFAANAAHVDDVALDLVVFHRELGAYLQLVGVVELSPPVAPPAVDASPAFDLGAAFNVGFTYAVENLRTADECAAAVVAAVQAGALSRGLALKAARKLERIAAATARGVRKLDEVSPAAEPADD